MMTNPPLKCLTALILLLVLTAAATTSGCDRDRSTTTATAASPAVTTTAAAPGQAKAEAGEAREEHSHEGRPGGLHLGNEMYHIARRMAAVWYAGRAGNAAMVDYQFHEIEEAAERIEAAGIVEHGVKIGPEFQQTVVGRFEAMEQAVEGGKVEEFERLYTDTLTQCNACHARAEHPFIVIERPTRNPYPNLSLGGK